MDKKTKKPSIKNEAKANKLVGDNKFEEVLKFINSLDVGMLTANLHDIRILARHKIYEGKENLDFDEFRRLNTEDESASLLLRYGQQKVNHLKKAKQKSPEEAIQLIDNTPENLRCPPLYSLRASLQASIFEKKDDISDKALHDCFKPCSQGISKELIVPYLETKLFDLYVALNLKIGNIEKKCSSTIQRDSSGNIKSPKPDITFLDLWPLLKEIKKTVDTLLPIKHDFDHLQSILSAYSLYIKYSIGLSESRVQFCVNEAKQYLSVCTKMHPEFEISWFQIFFAMLEGNIDYAISKCEEVLLRTPDSEIHELKIAAYIKLKDFQSALLENERYIELCNSNIYAFYSNEEFNPYVNKLQILLALERYSDFAEVIALTVTNRISASLANSDVMITDRKKSYEYHMMRSINIVKGLATLLEHCQYEVILEHLNYSKFEIEILRWFNSWCLVFLGKETDARIMFDKMDYRKMYEEMSKYKPGIWEMQEEAIYESIQHLYKGVTFSEMSDSVFIRFLDSLYKTDPNFNAIHTYALNASIKKQSRLENRADYARELFHYVKKKDKYLISFSRAFFDEIQKEIYFENRNTIYAERADERNRILSNLSHSIKNMLRSVIDPLLNLKEEFPERANVIDNALKGANLIREIVNSINLSYKTSLDDLLWDIRHPGTESVALQDMISSSLQYSIGNMFDFRYFPSYAENYYPRSLKKQDFEAVKEAWNAVSTTSSLNGLQDFAEKNMFKLSVNLTDSAHYHIGNEKSSAIKLLILFQEIIFNAVKYTSYVSKTERFIEIDLSEHDDKLKLQISNSFRPEVQAKTTGVGKLVIENFAKVLDCTPVITTNDNVYSITMEFHNIWRDNA